MFLHFIYINISVLDWFISKVHRLQLETYWNSGLAKKPQEHIIGFLASIFKSYNGCCIYNYEFIFLIGGRVNNFVCRSADRRSLVSWDVRFQRMLRRFFGLVGGHVEHLLNQKHATIFICPIDEMSSECESAVRSQIEHAGLQDVV